MIINNNKNKIIKKNTKQKHKTKTQNKNIK